MLTSTKRKLFEVCLKRSLNERIERGFIKTYKPVLMDKPFRVFDKMSDYKKWCNEKLPRFLGMYQVILKEKQNEKNK
jgi:hypothetical protein